MGYISANGCRTCAKCDDERMAKRLPNIGIIGKMASGKTTVAKYLEKHYGYKRASFADPMRDIVKDIFDVEDKSDPRYRTLMQKLGTDWFRSEDENVWVKHLLKRCTGTGWVVDDVRFLNEAGELYANNWVLVYLYSPEAVRKHHATKVRGDDTEQFTETCGHASESEVDQIPDRVPIHWIVPNNRSLEELYEHIDRIMAAMNVQKLSARRLTNGG